jgi:hypothetical protein
MHCEDGWAEEVCQADFLRQPRRSGVAASSFGENAEFQHGVPVAAGAAGSKLLFDEGVRQARTANPVRKGDVGMPAVSANDLPAGNGGLQRLDVFGRRLVFQKYDNQMAWIALRFLAEGVARNDRLPFLRRADEKIRFKSQAFSTLSLQQFFELKTLSRFASKNEIPALEQRLCVGEAELLEEPAKVGHGDHLVAGDINATEKGYIGRHDFESLTANFVNDFLQKPPQQV